MTRIDQFESLFKSAERVGYAYREVKYSSVTLLTDLGAVEHASYLERCQKFLSTATVGNDKVWHSINGDSCDLSIDTVLAKIREQSPSLICTYRNLNSTGWKLPYSLGEVVDVLTQHTDTPVLLLPHPQELDNLPSHAMQNTDCVMAMTDHLNGDSSLINYAHSMTAEKGVLWMTHVEDDLVLQRYLGAIAKIPGIDSDIANSELEQKLLDDARHFIETCSQVLQDQPKKINVKSTVTTGHHMREYRKIIDEHKIDLLIINTKDDDQLAMHGLAYPLAVGLRKVPLLLL